MGDHILVNNLVYTEIDYFYIQEFKISNKRRVFRFWKGIYELTFKRKPETRRYNLKLG